MAAEGSWLPDAKAVAFAEWLYSVVDHGSSTPDEVDAELSANHKLDKHCLDGVILWRVWVEGRSPSSTSD